MEESISVRIPKENLLEIKNISEEEKRKKSEVLRELLIRGIMEKKLEIALKKFQNNDATASKAAKIAGMPLTSFMDVLYKKGINLHYDVDELVKDFENVKEYDI